MVITQPYSRIPDPANAEQQRNPEKQRKQQARIARPVAAGASVIYRRQWK